MFVAVTVIAGWLGYELHWIRERENLLVEWRDMGGATISGPAPWAIRILGAGGVAHFEYGYFGWHSVDNPPLLAVNEDVRDRIARLFPESQIEMMNGW